jgi:hypothetical protein
MPPPERSNPAIRPHAVLHCLRACNSTSRRAAWARTRCSWEA